MNKRMKYPHRITTDQGNTVVKLIPSHLAIKMHKCPNCDKSTEVFEPHVLLLPTRFSGNRRYMHRGCYEELRKCGTQIVMHPNLAYLTPQYGR